MVALAAHLNLENLALLVTFQVGLELEHLYSLCLDDFSAIITAPQNRTGQPKVGSESRTESQHKYPFKAMFHVHVTFFCALLYI